MSNVSIYMGRAGTGKSRACYEQIQHILKTHPGDPIILLVPDSATYQAERDLAEFMDEKGFTTVRVVGLHRLRYQVFQSLGRQTGESLSSLGRKLLLRLILKREGPQLELFQQVAKQPHFGDVLDGLLAECKAFQVGPEELRRGAEEVQSLVLERKLKELAHLLEHYEGLVEDRFGSDVEPFQELIDVLHLSPIVQGAHVIIDGFHWFTPLHLQLIHRLIALAQSTIVTITMPTDPKDVKEQRKKGRLFSRPMEVYDEMMRRYPGASCRYFTESKRYIDPLLERLEGHFFRTPMKGNEGNQWIPLIEGYNRDREADAVCRHILAYMTEEGSRWRDVAIMLRDENTYGDVLEKQCERYGIPYFMDRRNSMMTHPFAEFLLSLFEVCRSVFHHDAMFRLLKTDFFPLSRREVDELENYVLEFGLRGISWLAPKWEYGEEERYTTINATKDIVMHYVRDFQDFAQQAHTSAAWCERIYGLLWDLRVPHTMKAWADEAEAQGDMITKSGHEQLYKHMISFLRELKVLSKDDSLTADEMNLLLEEGLQEVTYSLVPPSLDHVTITTIERGYTRESKHLYVMGLNEGVFPQRMGDEGILKDNEREALLHAGITLAEGALVKAFNENFLLYLACTRATHGLVLSYAKSDEEGGGLEPSLIIRRLQQQGYCGHPVKVPLTIPEEDVEEYLWRPAQSMALLASRISDVFKGVSMGSLWWSLYNWGWTSGYHWHMKRTIRGMSDRNDVQGLTPEVVQQLLFPRHLVAGSVTRLEKYQKCPFSFYAEYALRARPRKVKSFGAPEIGTFLHENLRLLGERLMAEGRQWRDVSPEEQEQLCREVSDTVKAMLGQEDSTARERYLLQRLEGTLRTTLSGLVDWSSKSSFDTIYVEQSFGGYDEGWEGIRIDLGEGNWLKLQGQIDRVDAYRQGELLHVAVMDYKSGKMNLCASDIYHGLKLQLITYLIAAHRGVADTGIMLPAASLYTFVKDDRLGSATILSRIGAEQLREESVKLENKGYFIREEELQVLQALDKSRAYGMNSDYVPIRLKKDGTVDSRYGQYLKTYEEFATMMNYTYGMMHRIGRHIVKGEFPIYPYRMSNMNPCKYCSYKALCRFESGRNRYHNLDVLDEQEAMDRMAQVVGEGGEGYEVDRSTTTRH